MHTQLRFHQKDLKGFGDTFRPTYVLNAQQF